MSFFSACHMAEKLGIARECVAVDHWVGDAHAGFHDTSVFDNFRAYAAENYPYLVFHCRSSPAALACFEDSSVALLHIDGLHTYEAVREDFHTWLRKMSQHGVLILHDTTSSTAASACGASGGMRAATPPSTSRTAMASASSMSAGSRIPSPRCCAAWPKSNGTTRVA